jgi:hypothetical protein
MSKYICGLCGGIEEDGNGLCVNDGHDQWIEITDLDNPELKDYVDESCQRLGMTREEMRNRILGIRTFDEALQEIIDYADEQGTRDDLLLDEEVHDTASAIASNVNNGGLEEQVKYLLTNNGIEWQYLSKLKEMLTAEE